MEPLKIALFTYSTKPRGGVVHTLRLAEELTSLNHQVHVYTLSTGGGFYRNLNVPHTLIPCPEVNYPSIDEKIESYIRIYYEYLSSTKEFYHIYHAEDCISANALLELRDNGFIKSFVRTVHHLDDFTSKSLIDCQLNSILEPDHVMVVSKYWERKLRSEYSLYPLMTQNGVDVDRFSKARGDKYSKELAKNKFSVNGCRVILSVGGIEPRKNTLTTLSAFNIAKSHFMEKGERVIWLIGGGETLFDYRAYRDQFFSQVERLGLKMGQDIRVLGNIPEANMPELYGAGDIFLFPSLKEGWGLVVLEAMASGVPVIASNIEPLTEYLRDNENAILIPPMNHEALAREMIKVLENEDLREKLATEGLKTAKSYSWRKTALRHLELYESIPEKRR